MTYDPATRTAGGDRVMEYGVREHDEMPHGMVVSNLLDLQARLRGDPASLVAPRAGRSATSVEPVEVANDDLTIVAAPVQRLRAAPDPLTDAVDDADERIQALQRRLQFLELEIDAYGNAVTTEGTQPPPPTTEASVVDLQHVVEGRLTGD
jgi:hypothetical protein